MDSYNSPNPESDLKQSAAIKVFGVGGGGCNALEQMIASGIRDVEFKCINTDAQALKRFAPEHVLKLGNNLTKGLGAGADPEVGSAAAAESTEEITAAIGDADMLFLAAGLGGGTGTGAVPLIARIAREMGVLTVAVVTEPFSFEGQRRRDAAAAGLEELRECADSMIVVPNENLLNYLGAEVTLVEAFAAANDVVVNAVQSISELITTSGLINVDFADVRTVMTSMGHAIMSTGRGMGEHRAEEAAIGAIKSPLLNNVDLKAAKGILANITSSSDLSMGEFQAVGDIIRQIAADDASVIVGTVFDEEMSHEMKVTIVATGLKPPKNEHVSKDNDDLVAKLTQPVPTASQKAAAEALAAAEAAAAAADAKAAADAASEANARANDQYTAELQKEAYVPAYEEQNINQDLVSEHTYKSEVKREVKSEVTPVPPPIPAQREEIPQTDTSQTDKRQNRNTHQTPELRNNNSSVAVDEVCMICGCVNGAHLPKCPWSNGGPTVAPQNPEPAPEPVKPVPELILEETTEKESPLQKLASNKKFKFGIAAAGVLAIASAWFLFNKNEDNTVVENPTVEEEPTNFIGDLNNRDLYNNIPTLELDEDEIEAAEQVGDYLIPHANPTGPPSFNSKIPPGRIYKRTEVTEFSE